MAAGAAPESPSSLQLWVPHSPLRGLALLKDSPWREHWRVTCNHVPFTCSLARSETPGTSDKQIPEEGGILPLPGPGSLGGSALLRQHSYSSAALVGYKGGLPSFVRLGEAVGTLMWSWAPSQS